jgi:hypothetical protein
MSDQPLFEVVWEDDQPLIHILSNSLLTNNRFADSYHGGSIEANMTKKRRRKSEISTHCVAENGSERTSQTYLSSATPDVTSDVIRVQIAVALAFLRENALE